MDQRPRMSPDELVERIEAAPVPSGVATRIIAVDGCGGAGKSEFARWLAGGLGGVPVVQTDDFASWDNPLGWWPRMLEEVIVPLAEGRPAHFRRFDWNRQELAEWQSVPAGSTVIIEGVSSTRLAFDKYLTFRIWIDTPREIRLQRGLERDGESARAQWLSWMQQEDEYVNNEHPVQRADLVVSGTQPSRLRLPAEPS